MGIFSKLRFGGSLLSLVGILTLFAKIFLGFKKQASRAEASAADAATALTMLGVKESSDEAVGRANAVRRDHTRRVRDEKRAGRSGADDRTPRKYSRD